MTVGRPSTGNQYPELNSIVEFLSPATLSGIDASLVSCEYEIFLVEDIPE